jgi:hypothetical protein
MGWTTGTVPQGQYFVSMPLPLDRPWGPRRLMSSSHRDLSARIKWPEREIKRPPPSNASVKNVWSYTLIPRYVLME